MTEANRSNTRYWTLIPFIVLCVFVIMFGQAFPPGPWYERLRKPSFSPPNWIFGVVWTPLYGMIAAAGWLLWERARTSAAMKWWFVQLALNAGWSWLFFGLHLMGAALVEILILWASIGATIVLSWRSVPAASYLLIPYWFWVAFAAVLNLSYWLINR